MCSYVKKSNKFFYCNKKYQSSLVIQSYKLESVVSKLYYINASNSAVTVLGLALWVTSVLFGTPVVII